MPNPASLWHATNSGQEIRTFASHWPVLNVSNVHAKLGFDAFRRLDRATLLVQCEVQNVKRQPAVWAPGVAPNWEQTLRTIYQVRCNLFHGEKPEQATRDRGLVYAADRIPHHFLAETGCLDWYDL
ncbi:hypothetical protein ACIPPQ_16790 [Sphingopyxis sp. LARHCG72]